MRRLAILTTLLALALSLVACGGGDDDGEEKSGPTKKQDTAAIEEVLVTYGATEGGEVCDYYAESQLAAVGGLGECVSANQDTSSALFTVENVVLQGDEATAVVTVKGQEDEVSTYGLTREGGDWKISDFPSDDDPAAESGEAPAPVVESEEEPPAEQPPATPKALVTDLLTDFGKASGSSVCDFYSVSFLEGMEGGREGCEQYFSDKPALNYKPGFVRAISETRVVAALSNRSSSAFARAEPTEPPDSPYGGWRISAFEIR